MYQDFFGLREAPFSIAPNPHYLYMSKQHHEALAHLVYGVGRDGGFVLLTGEVGTGKTTICRCFLEQIPADTDVAFILNPKLNAEQLLATICDELGATYFDDDISIKTLVDSINDYLLKSHSKGRHTVLIIDEAQNLSPEVLEQLRLLTNLETHEKKLLQIVLLGQPELQQMFLRDDLRQLAQRVTARFHLKELPTAEIGPYVRHRLGVAGGRDIYGIFPEKTLRKLYSITAGVPRVINLVCDRAMLGAYAQNLRSVDVRTLELAAREILGPSYPSALKAPLWVKSALSARAAVMVLAIALTATLLWAVKSVQINIAIEPQNVAVGEVVRTRPLADLPDEPSAAGADNERDTVVSLAEAQGSVPAALNADEADGSINDGSREEDGGEPTEATTEDSTPAALLAGKDGLSAETQVPASGDPKLDPTLAGEQATAADLAAAASSAPGSGDALQQILQGFLLEQSAADEMSAYRELLGLWRLSTNATSPARACQQFRKESVQCISRAGSLGFIRHLGLPAVVSLYANNGRKAFAVLRKLENGYATLWIKDQEITITEAAFNQAWRGQFTLVWKAPRDYFGPLRPGVTSPLSHWLREGFTALDQKPVGKPGNTYDAALVERVKAFQRDVGETDDGIVGEATMILLTRRMEKGLPLLMAEGAAP